MAKFNDFQWEDETEVVNEPARAQHDEFAQLLASERIRSLDLRVGNQVEGTILTLSPESDTVLIELSPSQTGVMDKQDLLDAEGNLSVQVGDRVTAFVTSLKLGILLSNSLGKSHQSGKDLEMACANQVPVRGRVIKDVKGGFEVAVLGKTAFCPVSKIDSRFVENKAGYINQDFDFLIEKYEQNGRNIVVSREKLLKELARVRVQELKGKIDSEEILTGTVSDLRDYGAMVDLGGVDGFLHISEISHARVSKPSDILSRGEKIRVRVIKIDDSGDRPKISLSMKAVEQDPWLSILDEFKVGSTYPGKVLSFGKHGAFVQLKPGIDGMIHLSEMSWEKRVYNPADILRIGDEVSVRILDINLDNHRVSLSLKDIKDDPWADALQSFKPGTALKVQVESLKGFGAIAALRSGVTGLIPLKTLKAAFGEAYKKHCSPPKEIDAIIVQIDTEQKKVLLSLPGAEVSSEDNSEEYREFLGVRKAKDSAARGTFGELLAKATQKK